MKIAHDIIDVPVDDIFVGDRLRSPTEEKVKSVAESIDSIGLRSPIAVAYRQNGDGTVTMDKFQLVTGNTRLCAAKLLGWKTIKCVMHRIEAPSEDDLDTEYNDDLLNQIWEIDENLIRGELTQAEETIHLTRRKELFEELRLSGQTLATSERRRFAKDTAEKTGRAKSDINLKLQRGKKIGDEDMAQIVGTSLDKGTEIDALANMSPADRRTIIARATGGERVSAVREIMTDEDVENTQFNALMNAWNRASGAVRQKFMEAVDEPLFDKC